MIRKRDKPAYLTWNYGTGTLPGTGILEQEIVLGLYI